MTRLMLRNGMTLAASAFVFATALLGATTGQLSAAQPERVAEQNARARNLPPEVLRMDPVQRSTKTRPAKPLDPPRMPKSILDGLVLSGKLLPAKGSEPIILTPRKPYHAASGSFFGCTECTYVTGTVMVKTDDSAGDAQIGPPRRQIQTVNFTFKSLVPQALYVGEIQLGHKTPSMSAHLDMYELMPGDLYDTPELVQTLSVTKGPVAFAFNAPALKVAHFKLVLDSQPSDQMVWVRSVKLLQVKP